LVTANCGEVQEAEQIREQERTAAVFVNSRG